MMNKKPTDFKIIGIDLIGTLTENSHIVRDILAPLVKKEYPLVKELYKLYTLGKMSREEFWKKIGVENYGGLEEKFLSLIKFEQGFIIVLENLSRKFKLVLLTNFSREWLEMLSKMNGKFLSYFDEIFVSSEIGFRKPDLRFYKKLLSTLNVEPQYVLIVDDKPKNLLAAHQLGFITCLVRRENYREDIKVDFSIKKFGELLDILN